MSNVFCKNVFTAIYGFIPCFAFFGFLQHRPFPGSDVAIMLILIALLFGVFNGTRGEEAAYLVEQTVSGFFGAAFYFFFYSFFLNAALRLGTGTCIGSAFMVWFIIYYVSDNLKTK